MLVRSLAKADVKSVFRLLPIHPSAFNSLGFYFQDSYYFDKCLWMGCSLSCYYFELFSTFIEWVVSFRAGSNNLLHYLDDFLLMGKAGSSDCLYLFTKFRIVSREFGIPLAEEKSVYPTSCLDFLGIQIDTVSMEFRLPDEKIIKIRILLDFILFKCKVKLRVLQSLLGLLAFASRVLPMGRVFSKRLYHAISGISSPFHFVQITSGIRDDLKVWRRFLSTFNGNCLWQAPFCSASALHLQTDAAGSCGYGAYWDGHCSADLWPASWRDSGLASNIVLLENFRFSCFRYVGC